MENLEKKLLLVLVIIILIILSMFMFGGSKDNKADNKQVPANIYKFDFSDNNVPGKTFKGIVNLDDGNVDFKIIYGCSLPNEEECPEDIHVYGTLNKEQLELVKNTYKKINPKDNELFLMGISYLLNGSILCDEEAYKTCETIGIEILESLE